MSREKRYVFKMALTAEQRNLIDDTLSECLGIPDGEKIYGSIDLDDNTMMMTILPPSEVRSLEVALKAMRERTELDNLGLIG